MSIRDQLADHVLPGEESQESSDGVLKVDNLRGLRDRVITLADAEEYVRMAGKNPDDYILTVRSKAYGKDLFSNGYTARPKHQQIDTGIDLEPTIMERLKGWKPKHAPKRGSFASPVLNEADYQFGKRIADGRGTPETLARVRAAVESFAGYVEHSTPANTLIVDNGDIVENLFNYANQTSFIDMPLTQQIQTATAVRLETIKILAPHTKTLWVGAVPSNHGEVRTGPKAPASYVYDDWGLHIHHQLELILAGDSRFDNVRFIRPEPHQHTLTIKLSDTKLAMNHGHKAGASKAAIEKWVQGQESGRQPGWDADIWVLAHYHHLYMLSHGNGRSIIGVTSPEPGSDQVRASRGVESRKGLTAFDVADGHWHNLRIL